LEGDFWLDIFMVGEGATGPFGPVMPEENEFEKAALLPVALFFLATLTFGLVGVPVGRPLPCPIIVF
jgi:hypothetical protein